MRIPLYVPVVAAAAVIGIGIYAEVSYQREHPVTLSSIPPQPQIAQKASPAHKQVSTRTTPKASAKATTPALTNQAQAPGLLPEGRLVKITGVVYATSPQTLVVERNCGSVTVRMSDAHYITYPPSVVTMPDRTNVGETVTVYGRVRETKSAPVVDADAVYAPQSKRLIYSNGQNQTTISGTQTRVRFTANYQSL